MSNLNICPACEKIKGFVILDRCLYLVICPLCDYQTNLYLEEKDAIDEWQETFTTVDKLGNCKN